MIRKNLIKSLSVVMATMLAVMTVACGRNTVTDAITTQVTQAAAEQVLENAVTANNILNSVSEESGKVETVYVTADANGAVNDVIVSEWLKNAEASSELSDKTDLKNIVNVKGNESFKDNGDGTVTWEAGGSDIYYQGTTDKELPVKMKITYTLDGKEIAPEDLAGKSGRVTMRFEYENEAKQTVDVDGKEIDVYTPFAMVSGMMLDADKFSNVEISNGKVISSGGNFIVMGVAMPGLKESLDISEDKWDELEDADEIKEKLSNSFEITADTTDFELGMTITMASSDILSDFGVTDLTDSDKIEDLKDDMEQLNDGANKLVDGSKALKDGTEELRDGTAKLYDGTTQLYNGTSDLYDGTAKLYDGTGSLCDGAAKLDDGAGSLYDGTAKLYDGTKSLNDGANKLYDGTKDLSDGAGKLVSGTKDLSKGAASLYDGTDSLGKGAANLKNGVAAYTDAVSTLKDGADQLKGGVESAKAGSEQLVTNMETAVSSAGTLAEGAAKVSGGVKTLKDMMEDMVCNQLTEKLETLSVQKSAYGAALTWLTNVNDTDTEPDDAAFAVINGIDGSITSKHEAVKVKKAALAALSGQATSSLYVINNYEMLVTTVKTGTLYAEEGAEPEAEPAQTPADTSSDTTSADASVETSPVETPSDTTPVETPAQTPAETPGQTPSEDETLNQTSSQDLLTSGTSEDEENEEGSEETSVTGNETKTTTVTSTPSGCSDADVAKIAGYVQQYSILCGAVSSAYQAAGATYDETLAMKESLESNMPAIGELYTGAQQLAGGSSQLAAGLGKLSEGQKSLDEGLGDVIDGAGKLAGGAGQLTAQNQALNNGVAQLAGGIGQVKDGAGKLVTGAGQLTDGATQLAGGIGQVKDGAGKLATGAGQLGDGAGQLKDGASQLKDGTSQLRSGASDLRDGAGQLLDGAGQLKDGASELNDGAKALDDGAAQLDEGVQELMEGMLKFDEEGIRKLYDAFDGDLTEFADRVTAIQKAGSNYNSFGGSDDDVDSSVKFVIKTEAIKSL